MARREEKDGRLIVSYQGAISAVTHPIATNKALQNRCKLSLSLCLKTTPQHLKKKIAGNCIFSIHNTLKSAGGPERNRQDKAVGNFGFGKSIVFVVVFLLWSSLIPISFFCCSVLDAILRTAQGTMDSLWVETVMCFYATPGTIAVIFCAGCKHPLRRFFFFIRATQRALLWLSGSVTGLQTVLKR